MKKKLIVILAALAALAICVTALANTAAVELYDKTAELLFDTGNVTLKAHADFSLDGIWFKTADGEWKQEGDRTFRQFLLTAPRKDGTELKNGYTIVTEKNDLYLMEVFTPGIVRQGSGASRTSLLHSTVETKQLVGLGRILAAQADLLLGEGVITKAEDGSYRIILGEDTPEIVNAALNQIARFAAKRYFNVDFDMILTDRNMLLSHYETVTRGILYTFQGFSVRKAEITLKTDADGNPELAEGIVSLNLETSADGVKQLDINFKVEISDRGTTSLKPFDPKDYNVSFPADEPGYYGSENGEEYGMVPFEEESVPENQP